eukprot:Rhum_TRINITY_DN12003_c0_g1::Rhum_TRINITY_DN12003_c0_g1_i1::g.48521::m.48521/K16190/GLCAK; glucuronokinase
MSSRPMTCVLLAAGFNPQLEEDLAVAGFDGEAFAFSSGVPKALLPVAGQPILDAWWSDVKERRNFRCAYLVVNAAKYKHFERWATSSDFPLENIVNTGATSAATSAGAVADFNMVVQSKKIHGDVLVVSGDMLRGEEFDVTGVQRFFNRIDGDLCLYYDVDSRRQAAAAVAAAAAGGSAETEAKPSAGDEHTRRGMLTLDEGSKRVTHFAEKPSTYASSLASVAFYCLKEETCLAGVPEFLATTPSDKRGFGHLMERLTQLGRLHGMKVNMDFKLIGGDTTLREYLQVKADVEAAAGYAAEAGAPLSVPLSRRAAPRRCRERCYARVGLLGNPSDGFNGKTISVTIGNFWADVVVQESERLRLVPHPVNDPCDFGRLSDLVTISQKEGYVGGMRLMQATCKKFYEHCSENGIALPRRNFTLSYDTNIPRQVGLAGSSCIVTCVVKALMAFYDLKVDVDIPKAHLPSLILSVETEELRINAGLQDRVVQVYEGLVYMDFSHAVMASNKGVHGAYKKVPARLPDMFLMYAAEPSDSGVIHSDVKGRWLSGDAEVAEAMASFASLAEQGLEAISNGDHETLKALFDANFDLRRSLYTDACLGRKNLDMIELSRAHGGHVKFPGSGGAIIGILDDPAMFDTLKLRAHENGFVCVGIVPHVP